MNERTGSPRRRDPRRVPRVLAPGEDLPPIPLADMDDDLFCEAVSRDVRGRLDARSTAELRDAALRQRRVRALERLCADVDAQLENTNKDGEWRQRAKTFRRAIERHLDEASGAGPTGGRRQPRAVTRGPGGAERRRVRELEAAIVAHRDHECDPSCDEGCPADEELWALVAGTR